MPHLCPVMKLWLYPRMKNMQLCVLLTLVSCTMVKSQWKPQHANYPHSLLTAWVTSTLIFLTCTMAINHHWTSPQIIMPTLKCLAAWVWCLLTWAELCSTISKTLNLDSTTWSYTETKSRKCWAYVAEIQPWMWARPASSGQLKILSIKSSWDQSLKAKRLLRSLTVNRSYH